MAKVFVFYFKKFDVQAGDYIRSQRPATLRAITIARGEPMLETGQEVDESDLDDEGHLKKTE